jgi:hypothetical protein
MKSEEPKSTHVKASVATSTAERDRVVTHRTFTWANDLHSQNSHGSDLRHDSPLTLRSDGTGHFTAFIDSNDTWTVWFILHVPGQQDIRLPNALGGPNETFVIPPSNRDFEFGWHGANVLNSITSIDIFGHI